MMFVKPRVLVTVAALGAVAIAGMYFDQPLVTGAAVGALVSYLGRMNGRAEGKDSGSTTSG